MMTSGPDCRPRHTGSGLVVAFAGFLRRPAVPSWTRVGLRTARVAAASLSWRSRTPNQVPFPEFHRVLITHAELRDLVKLSHYATWRTSLASVQGIYLIADTSTGQLHVGKADGGERILGRWAAYARDGHGGNVALRDLAGLHPNHRRHVQFSILRVFGPSVATADVDEAEYHHKRALLTRQHRLNRHLGTVRGGRVDRD